MPSYGEKEISCNSTLIGTVRVTGIRADAALYPRLMISLEVELREVADRHSNLPPIEKYELRDLSGELRTQENQGTVGYVYWAGQRRHVRSNPRSGPGYPIIGCDLDYVRLERIEGLRDGAAPSLWLHVWPTLVAENGQHLDADVSCFRLDVPRDTWLALLKGLNYGSYEILEVRLRDDDAEHFPQAVNHVREARRKALAGDREDAVGCCRRALESLGKSLRVDQATHKDKAWQIALEAFAPSRVAEQYARISGALRQLAGFAIHDHPTAPVAYSRAEAEFIVRSTEGLLVMISDLVRPLNPEPRQSPS